MLLWCFQIPHIVMDRSLFTVGQGRQCDLCIGDPSISKSLCSLRHIESEVILLFFLVFAISLCNIIILFILHSEEVHPLLYLKSRVTKVLSKSMAKFILKSQPFHLKQETRWSSAHQEGMLMYPKHHVHTSWFLMFFFLFQLYSHCASLHGRKQLP